MMMKKIKYLILPFLAILGVVNVKAYDLSGIPTATRIDYGLYYDTTLVTSPLPSCTSANEYDCYITDRSLPNESNTYNNFRIVVRDNMNTTFSVGTQYKISMYFEQETAGYWFSSARVTQVTGNTYRNFTNWTTDDITIISYSLSLIDSEDGMYRFDVVFVPSTTQVAGFNFRIWQDYETVSNNNNYYIRMWRNVSITQLSPGQIDYTQDLDNINTNITNMRDDIIDNQNQNTQDIIDNQNNINRVCNKKINGSSILEFSKILDTNGSINNAAATFGISDYIPVELGVKVNKVYNYWIATCFYKQDKSLISCIPNSSMVANTYLDLPQNTYYVRFSLHKTQGPELSICTNGNQAIADSITDTTPPDTSGLSNATGWLPPGPVDSILNLPLTLLQSLNNAFSSNSCQPITVNLPYVNAPIVIPCMSTIWEGFGLLPLFTWIGRVIGGILLYKYLIGLYKWVDDTLTMRENNNFDDGSLG